MYKGEPTPFFGLSTRSSPVSLWSCLTRCRGRRMRPHPPKTALTAQEKPGKTSAPSRKASSPSVDTARSGRYTSTGARIRMHHPDQMDTVAHPPPRLIPDLAPAVTRRHDLRHQVGHPSPNTRSPASPAVPSSAEKNATSGSRTVSGSRSSQTPRVRARQASQPPGFDEVPKLRPQVDDYLSRAPVRSAWSRAAPPG